MSALPLEAFRQYPGEIVNSRTGKPADAPTGYLIIGQDWPTPDTGRYPIECGFCRGRAAVTSEGLRRHCSAREDRPVACRTCAEEIHGMSAHFDDELGAYDEGDVDLSEIGWPNVVRLLKLWRADRRDEATMQAKELFAQCARRK